MAKTNNGSARQTHVSPGVYTKETDLTYASKSLGITTLGIVGETVKGPAFQPISISDWREFQRYFGGTNPEKFRGSQYPKYELPYIAQSYLQQSNNLKVVRVLGLSGVNAGPAWVMTAHGKVADSAFDSMAVLVLRSRGEHKKVAVTPNPDPNACGETYTFDGIEYYAKDIEVKPSTSLSLVEENCEQGFSANSTEFESDVVPVDAMNYGVFTLEVTLADGNKKSYAVSLNPGDRNYIYKVLGGDPEVGETEIFVEELYDIALQQLVERDNIDGLNATLVKYTNANILPKFEPVNDILLNDESTLTRKDVGKRFLCTQDSIDENGNMLNVHTKDTDTKVWGGGGPADIGHIYTVVAYTTPDGTREYYYGEITGHVEMLGDYTTAEVKDGDVFDDCVLVLSDNTYYVYSEDEKVVKPITMDMNNYKESFRFASTPWVVSELKGSAEHIELNKLFRFHTISDGAAANTEVKISIENIDPSNGTFNVVVRDFNDTDNAPIVYEKYKGVNLIPGDENYIAMRIGSLDDTYVNVSSYITVEVNENEKTFASIPAGFLGYPVRNFTDGVCVGKPEATVKNPYFEYNTVFDTEIRPGKQYFGVSNLSGVDTDILKYKGVEAYNDDPKGLTPCFHLDSRILSVGEEVELLEQKVFVDGKTGYQWMTVGKGNVTSENIEPRIGNEELMSGTIYEDKRLRKFTMAFYGGFDGWDYYRTSRSNSDEFTASSYKGKYDRRTGAGVNFSVIRDPENYGFEVSETIINSDWYAYLFGVKQFANPKTIDINMFATPGIDYVNNNKLVNEVITMLEEERADSIYVVTTPDKPFGAGDTPSEMFSADDAVFNLEEADIDSNYTCTYYPWVKYYDSDNSVYIYLPPTRDAVRNFAYTDNTKYPWFAAAGWSRGDMLSNAVKPRKTLKLAEQDTLYDGRINFINSFANEGMKIWGDKNLQVRESQMNRISKRRLLLHIRKLCAIASIGLIFDPNDNTTKQSFESAINPILSDVMSKRGIRDYRIEIDDSQEARDRLELPCRIYLKLVPNLEYITIDFVITPSGVSFDDI